MGSPNGRHRQRGYVLIMVMVSLALIALVAARFSARIDELRAQALSWDRYAKAQVEAESAQQAAIYWMATRPPGLAGFEQSPGQELRADGRLYQLPSGAQVRVQDARGLYSLHVTSRGLLTGLLQHFGVRHGREDAFIDVLLDYQDTDKLKRLQGAEDDEYRRLGLPPPRNDFLVTPYELEQMPGWHDDLALARKVAAVSSTDRDVMINPNTAPLPVLAALVPDGRPEQFELFRTLRNNQPFGSAKNVLAATGLIMREDGLLFHVGDKLRLTVWAPGLPHALQYNLALDLDGRVAAWHITDQQPVPRDKNIDADIDRPTPFPLSLAPARP